MKLAAVTYGTEGDTRPLAALCRALIDAGNEVTMLAGSGTLDSVGRLAVPHAALAGDIRAALQPNGGIPTAAAGKSRLDETAKTLAALANSNAESWMSQILEVAGGCDGLIVAGLAAFVGFSAAEKLGIPVVGAGMIPLTPTVAFPSPFMPPRPLPRPLNRLSYRLVAGVLWKEFGDATNQARARAGLAPGRKIWEGHPMLYGISPTLLPQPGDWPVDATMCGQWAESRTDWVAPPRIQEFLNAGDPPIYIGFGSMTGVDQPTVSGLVVEALAGRRAIFSPGWSAVEDDALPSNVLVIDEAPHDWLFPRTSIVIHHGGSGTTHSAARAGVPSVVVPFAADQFFWAKRLHVCGAAPKPQTFKQITASTLARSIAAADVASVRARANALGASMRAENGLALAVDEIHRLIRSS